LTEEKNRFTRTGMKPTGFLLPVCAAWLAAQLSACAVGPDYHPPPAPPVTGYTPAPLPASTGLADGVAQNYRAEADISADWWTLYRSPQLNSLIDAALRNSPNLSAARQTLIEAQEDVRAEQGNFLPSLSGSFQAERERISSAELADTGDTTTASNSNFTIPPYTVYQASIAVSYNPDVFGGERRQVESLAAQADYERFELEAAYLSLTANIVTAAVNEASLNAQVAATRLIVSNEQRQLDILNKQFSFGGVAMADVLNEQANLQAAIATLPPLQSQLAQARNQLADLVGLFPSQFDIADFTLDNLALPEDLPVSLPSALVDQRPDIQAASAQLHEASANLGVATANMLPQISLSAEVGHQALNTATLFTPQTLLWSLVSGITQPIFEGGTLYARRKAAVAALRGAGATYQETVLAAFENVANALEALQFDAAALAADQAAEQASAHSLAVTQNQFKLGGQPITAVLTAQTTYQNAIVTRVKAQATRLADTAALYQALGGGWWHRNDAGAAGQCCGIIP
jgi:NodT family efflux transporter outer membrane factor (OMF) lipoprotein